MIINIFLLMDLQAQDNLGSLTYDQLSEGEPIVAGFKTAFKAMEVEEVVLITYDRNNHVQRLVTLNEPKLEKLHTCLTGMLTRQYGCAD